MHSGSCLCGAVTFEIEGALQPADACHCSQCRKVSGHFWSSTDVAESNLRLTGADRLTWFQPSERAKRGFCSVCGSALFWKSAFKDSIAVAMGAIAAPTGTRLGHHIFVADKGDYYDIADGLPQSAQ